jgi:branched-chain amino acid transport system permease protein
MKHLLQRRLSLLGTVVALVAACFIPVLVTSPYYLDLVIITLVNAVLAVAFLLMLRPGLINLGLIAFWGIGAYTSAILTTKFHWSFWAALPTSMIVTGLLALVIGFLLIERGSGGFSFVTLSAVIGMVFPAAVGALNYLGAYNGIREIPKPDAIHLPGLRVIDFSTKADWFYLALFLFIIVLVAVKAFNASSVGRAWTSVGMNPRLAESMGVDLFRYKLFSLVLGSMILGLFGSFYAHYMTHILPNSFGMWGNISVQVFAVLGGIGYPILGPLLGAAVMTLVPEYLRVTSSVAPIIEGAILILLILFLPRGLLGILDYRPQASQWTVKSAKTVGRLLLAAKRGDGVDRP